MRTSTIASFTPSHARVGMSEVLVGKSIALAGWDAEAKSFQGSVHSIAEGRMKPSYPQR